MLDIEYLDLKKHLDNLNSTEDIKKYIFKYFYNLKQIDHKNFLEMGKRNIINTVLTHPEYNQLKEKWLPLPLNEEFNQFIRKEAIKNILND